MVNMRISRLSLLFIFLTQVYDSDAKLELKPEYNYTTATICVANIIKVHYQDYQYKVVTFFNFNAENMEILKAVHSQYTVSIMNRRPPKKIKNTNRGYVIYVSTAEDFKSYFFNVVAEEAWMPYAKFLIVVEALKVDQLYGMFQVLLEYHVKDAIIVDGLTADTYTYDPFKNNGCFKRFDQIIPLGKCLADMPPDYFPNTLKNGLQNCTLQIAATHWPPYTVDPTQTNITIIGMDEHVYSLLAKQEHFHLNISYFAELSDEVSVVDENMVASGPLRWLQEKKYDAVTGSYVLVAGRAAAFTYICGHLAHDDYIGILVRQAGDVPSWKILILAFKPLVWLLLGISFLAVSILIIIISKSNDRSLLILNLIDYMFMHTCRIRRTKRLDFILILWLVFACLIDYHYLSVLYSITTKPIQDYQIAQLSDLGEYNIRPCLSNAIQAFGKTVVSVLTDLDIKQTAEAKPQCNTMGNSLETVSKSEDLYTVVPYSLYHANRYKYYDKYGSTLLFSFRKPLSKIIYASYFYKGFPLHDKFNLLSMRVNAAGLMGKIWQDYDYFQKKLHQTQTIYKRPTVTVPWYIIIIGGLASAVCFLGEIVYHNCMHKQHRFLRN